MKFIPILGILLFSFTAIAANAQQAEMLVGEWKFQDIRAQADLDSTSTKQDSAIVDAALSFFESLRLFFGEDGRYAMSTMFNQDEGEWALNAQTIVLTSDKGEIVNIQIIKLSEDRLDFIMDRGPELVMSKVGTSPKTRTKGVRNKLSTTTASVEQLSKKWFIKSITSPDETEEQVEIINELVAGSYILLSKDGTYEARALGVTSKGTWKLGEDRATIITQIEDEGKRLWSIHSISQHDLVLLRGTSEERWIMSSEE